MVFTLTTTVRFPTHTIGIADPCYLAEGHLGFGAEIKVAVPTWDAYVRRVDLDRWGVRVCELRLTPSGTGPGPDLAYEGEALDARALDEAFTVEDAGTLGVDSGTCIAIDLSLVGALDYDEHVMGALDRRNPDGSSDWWPGPEGSILCNTGLGDGSYGIWAVRDATGTVAAVSVYFGIDWDSDED